MSRGSEDADQFVDRISHILGGEAPSRLTFLVGSGMSRPHVPATGEMVRRFVKALGVPGTQLFDKYAGATEPSQYQVLAEEMVKRRGDMGLAAVIRPAVLEAYSGELTQNEEPDDRLWMVPDGLRSLARIYAKLSQSSRGPILTTNFDPLIEVALRREGVPVTQVVAAGIANFGIENIFGSSPVVHLHGVWHKGATLSTLPQLTKRRSQLESVLKHVLSDSTIVVIGYGGWSDAFMNCLTEMVLDGRSAALDSEIMWVAHGGREETLRNPMLERIHGVGGVVFYFDVDASAALERVASVFSEENRRRRSSLPGWEAVPRPYELEGVTPDQFVGFMEGAQPSWAMARALPRLSPTSRLINQWEAVSDVKSVGDRVFCLFGPTGEGKSLALRQMSVHMAASLGDRAVILNREPSGSVSSTLVDHLRNSAQEIYLVVDEADLVLSEIEQTLSHSGTGGQVNWILAIHSHYLGMVEGMIARRGVILEKVEFGHVSGDDCLSLAESWLRFGLLPEAYTDLPAAEIAQMILEGAESRDGRSLFGAVLHLWEGDDLRDRVADLLAKLAVSRLRGQSFASLLLAIAIVQVSWDPEGDAGNGISTALLGALVGISNQDVVRMVITPLGREVGLSRNGSLVYVRHPAVARALVDVAAPGDLESIVFQLGKQGAILRYAPRSGASSDDGRTGYRLWHVSADPRLAIYAAKGTVYGAPQFLEPRVGFMTACRRAGDLERAERYARELSARGLEYEDTWKSVRGYWVERAVNQFELGHADAAIAMALISLTDLGGAGIGEQQFSYGLVNVERFCRLRTSPSGRANNQFDQLYRSVSVLLDRLPPHLLPYSGAPRHRFSSDGGRLVSQISDLRSTSEVFRIGEARRVDWRFRKLLEWFGRFNHG